jgi:hypothetical protein
VLIIPPGHAQSLRRLSVREKRLLGGILAVVAALAVVLVIAFSTGGPTSAHGCIYATIPAATGAQQISQCGAAARDTCASVRTPGAFTEQAARVVAGECRKAGLSVAR